MLRKDESIETESRLVVAKGWGEAAMGMQPLGSDRHVLKLDCGFKMSEFYGIWIISQ